MNSKSLPSVFKIDSFRRKAIENSQKLDIKYNLKNKDYLYSPSTVRVSSPLTKETLIYTNEKINENSWVNWTYVSSSISRKRQNIKKSWKTKQTRKTYPPSTKELLGKKEKKKRFIFSNTNLKYSNSTKSNLTIQRQMQRSKTRQSLQDILTHFNDYDETIEASKRENPINLRKDSCNTITNSVLSNTISSASSLSIKLGRIVKKTKKNQFLKHNRPPSIFISKDNSFNLFQSPQTTISSQSSIPLSPITFPIPPERSLEKHQFDLLKTQTIQTEENFNFLKIKNIAHKFSYSLNRQKEYKLKPILIYMFWIGFLCFPCWWMGAYLKQEKVN